MLLSSSKTHTAHHYTSCSASTIQARAWFLCSPHPRGYNDRARATGAPWRRGKINNDETYVGARPRTAHTQARAQESCRVADRAPYPLRRGEVGLLPANAIKDEFDPAAGGERYWINVEPSADFDPRYEAPGLKTETARRQLPISHEILKVHDVYVQNYRAKGSHPFLITSQQARPLSLRAFGYVFETVTANLTSPARRALESRRLDSVSAHDLRHTAAVLRLHRYVEAGNELPLAIEKLRVFFGWSHASEMPRLYARAYFEPTLADVWHDGFDRFVDTLRQVEGAHAS